MPQSPGTAAGYRRRFLSRSSWLSRTSRSLTTTWTALELGAVYEGEWGRIGPKRTVDLRVALRWRLYDEGITEFPLLYMTTRSDWDQYPEPE